MIYNDRIYGTLEINEPVLLDLLQTAAMRRMHGVLQHGISGLIGVTRATTRFEHSMGVMALVRHLGAPIEEQITALLHDVSHTAFSHVIDYVYGGHESQNYHDEIKEDFVRETDIPRILRIYGYDWCNFVCLSDEQLAEQFPLLEQPSPALCADRLDYFLRDGLDLGLATKSEIQYALDHLIVHNKCIVTDDIQAARWMGYTFIAADKASWANFREVGLYELTAQAIRRSLDLNILSEKDILGCDHPAWEKILSSDDPQLIELVELITPETVFVWDENDPTFWVSTKLRTIDPYVRVNGEVHPLSTLDPEFANEREGYLRSCAGKWPIKVIK